MRPPSAKSPEKPVEEKKVVSKPNPAEVKKKKPVIISAKSYDPSAYSEDPVVPPPAEPVSLPKPTPRTEPKVEISVKEEEVDVEDFPVHSSRPSTASSTSSTFRRQLEMLKEREAKMEEKAKEDVVDRDTQDGHIESLNDEIAMFLARQQEETDEVQETESRNEVQKREERQEDDVIGLLNG